MNRFNFCLLAFTFCLVYAQGNYVFGPSIRVNDDPPGTHEHRTTQRSIACRGDTVYVVWEDNRYGSSIWYNHRVFFSKSTDAGNTWSANLLISQDINNYPCGCPHLSLDKFGDIYVAYIGQNGNTNNCDIYFVKSTNGGSSFTSPIMVNDSAEINWQVYPALAVDSLGQNVYVVWQDRRNPQYRDDIYLARSTDGGLSFLPAVRVNDDTGASYQWFPVIACDESGQNVYVAWEDERDTLHGWDVYFSRSTDYGQTFEANYPVNDTNISGNSFQGRPSIYWKDGVIYIAFDDWRAGAVGTYFDKSIDNGMSFGEDVCVVDIYENSAYPSITVNDAGKIFVVWEDGREYSSYGVDIYFSFSTDGGNTFSPNVRVNDHLGVVNAWDWDPGVGVNDSGRVFVAWSSTRNDPSFLNFDIYFAAGNYVGIEEAYDARLSVSLQCYPNPFTDKLEIRCDMPDKRLQIKIYDINGRIVKQWDYPILRLSNYFSWDGTDQGNHRVPAGIYFLELVKNNHKYVKKIVKIGGEP